jgi:hypothetical protein
MGWIRKHLNWTLGITYLVWGIIICGLFSYYFGFPLKDSAPLEGEFWFIVVIFSIAQILYLASIFLLNWWVLKQKNRNELWIIMLFVPLGFIGIIFLTNKPMLITQS